MFKILHVKFVGMSDANIEIETNHYTYFVLKFYPIY